jgi:hypothetical protein
MIPEPTQAPILASDFSRSKSKLQTWSLDSSSNAEASWGGGASMAGESVGSQYYVSTTGKSPYVKPMKKLDRPVRRRGPFAMVGPSMTTKGGVQPSLLLPKEARDEALNTMRERKRVGLKDYNVVSKADIKHHNEEHLDLRIKSALQEKKARATSPSNRLRTATSVSMSTMQLKRDSMLHSVTAQAQAGKEATLMKLKGVDKLNFLIKGLDAKEGTNWKDLKGKVLTRTEKHDPRVIAALKERRRKREIAMRKYLRAPSMLHHKEDEELEGEQWLKSSIHAFNRQLAHKDNRVQVHEDRTKKISRMCRKNKKTLLKHKQLVSAGTQQASNLFQMLGGSGFDHDRGVDQVEVDRKLRESMAPMKKLEREQGRGSPTGRSSRGGSPVQFLTGF